MKNIFLIFTLFSISIIAQETDYNIDANGCGVKGYDLVSYFDGEATSGKKEFSYTYDEVEYLFSSQGNLDKFKLNPTQYLPQYGGYCAYAMGKKGEKVKMDPSEFEIRDGKLYLFYKSYFNDTHKKWEKEGAEKLKEKADENWEEITTKP